MNWDWSGRCRRRRWTSSDLPSDPTSACDPRGSPLPSARRGRRHRRRRRRLLGRVPPGRGRGRRPARRARHPRCRIVVEGRGRRARCFSDAVNVALGKRSLGLLRGIGTRPGGEIDLHTAATSSSSRRRSRSRSSGRRRGAPRARRAHQPGGHRRRRAPSPLGVDRRRARRCWTRRMALTPEAVVQGTPAAPGSGRPVVAGVGVAGVDVRAARWSVAVRAGGTDHGWGRPRSSGRRGVVAVGRRPARGGPAGAPLTARSS